MISDIQVILYYTKMFNILKIIIIINYMPEYICQKKKVLRKI